MTQWAPAVIRGPLVSWAPSRQGGSWVTWAPLREQVAPSWANSWVRACYRLVPTLVEGATEPILTLRANDKQPKFQCFTNKPHRQKFGALSEMAHAKS